MTTNPHRLFAEVHADVNATGGATTRAQARCAMRRDYPGRDTDSSYCLDATSDIVDGSVRGTRYGPMASHTLRSLLY